jgi:hypothetical protein
MGQFLKSLDKHSLQTPHGLTMRRFTFIYFFESPLIVAIAS